MKDQLIIAAALFLPLGGAVFSGILAGRLPGKIAAAVSSAAVLGAFLLTLLLFGQLGSGEVSLSATLFTWVRTDTLSAGFSLLVDHLSVWMMLIITGVGFVIHLYSAGYMKEDEGIRRYFAYLNLFVFSMLLLVMSDNYLLMFFGWEGVGLCSYLLIGFWYDNAEYGKAARKAFIMNRIGDLGLLTGIFMIFATFGSTGYAEVAAKAAEAAPAVLTTITLLLFAGATGKSAQIPLYTWLPDAMAGPTPVSALIHAATMVTAGVYLVVRSAALFVVAPFTLDLMAAGGLATSLLAGVIALRQSDIKKVLAYSTVSQLGLMFLALGAGAFSAAMFHLTTHAFFKALLFLGAGSVIHAMGGEQDIRRMGGLRSALPLTHRTFLVGALAISGFPLLSGFFSKDEILLAVFGYHPWMWALALAASAITGIYMMRLLFLTFYGDFRGTEHQAAHLHESPAVMTGPLLVLALLSVLGGLLNLPALYAGEGRGRWLGQFLTTDAFEKGHALSHRTEWLLAGVTTVMVLAVIAGCYQLYVRRRNLPAEDKQLFGWSRWAASALYVDALYDALVVRPANSLGNLLHSVIDRGLIDGLVNLTGRSALRSGHWLRRLQSGNVELYLLTMVLGIILILLMNSGN